MRLRELRVDLTGADLVGTAAPEIHGQPDQAAEHDVPPHPAARAPGGGHLEGLVAVHLDRDDVRVLPFEFCDDRSRAERWIVHGHAGAVRLAGDVYVLGLAVLA